jgi:rare lipoprotein A
VQPAAYEVPRTPAYPAYTVPVRAGSLFVQAGAFSVRDNAERLQVELGRYGDTRIDRVEVGGRTLYRVRLGPLDSLEAAQRTLSALTDDGYALAQVVVE